MSKPGRNDPCPCGSGKKYKKCCVSKEQPARPRSVASPNSKHFITELRPDVDEAADRLMERLKMGEGRRVEAEIKALWEEHPRYHTTNYMMGVYISVVMNDPAEAMPFFQSAVKIFPPFPEAHYNLGVTAVKKADIPTAVSAFREAERYSYDDDGIKGMARKELQFLEQALLKTTSFKSLDDYVANARLFEEAFQCLNDRRFEKSVELFTRVLKDNPKHVQSYGNMALAYAGLGRRAAAMECFDRALELDPKYELARINQRQTAQMKEGEPFLPEIIEGVDYYRDRR